MLTDRIIILSVKVEPLKDAPVVMDDSPWYWCEVFVPVPATPPFERLFSSALDRAKESLAKQRLILADVFKMIEFDESEWIATDHTIDGVLANVDKARRSGNVVVGTMRSNAIEARHCFHITVCDD